MCLTFDAGASDDGVAILLKTLQSRGLRATFFLTGQFCRKFPQDARAIADAGMELGNHSDNHPYFTHLTTSEIHDQLSRAESEIVATCGRGARPLFRYPYGDSNPRTDRSVASDGYQAIGWSLDSLDSVGSPKSVDFITNRVSARIRPGMIVLMHVSYRTSAEALSSILDTLAARNLHQAPVSTLLLASHPLPGSGA